MHSEMSDGEIREELGEVGCIFSHHHGITPESGKHERRERETERERWVMHIIITCVWNRVYMNLNMIKSATFRA